MEQPKIYPKNNVFGTAIQRNLRKQLSTIDTRVTQGEGLLKAANLALIKGSRSIAIRPLTAQAFGPRWISTGSDYIDSTESTEPPIPLYQRYNESMEVKRARLLYQSRKRGMLENDLLLSTFAHRYLNTFDQAQLDVYDSLINSPSNDWDLFYWVVGKKETPPEFNSPIMDLLKEHAKNSSKENRTRQPPLY